MRNWRLPPFLTCTGAPAKCYRFKMHYRHMVPGVAVTVAIVEKFVVRPANALRLLVCRKVDIPFVYPLISHALNHQTALFYFFSFNKNQCAKFMFEIGVLWST